MSATRTQDAVDIEKRNAALGSLDEVVSGMRLGLGTGSTVRFLLEGLAFRLKEGRLEDVLGVPTSTDTEQRCRELGIPTIALHEVVSLDLAIDGADEVSPALDLVKGLGGALLREKMVAQAASRFVVIADSGKEVEALGRRSPVPVEVIPFGWRTQLGFFRSLGAEPDPRVDADGRLVRTDNGNHLIDLRFPHGVPSPARLDRELQARAGIVEHGLFLGMAHRAYIGSGDGVISRERPPS